MVHENRMDAKCGGKTGLSISKKFNFEYINPNNIGRGRIKFVIIEIINTLVRGSSSEGSVEYPNYLNSRLYACAINERQELILGQVMTN
jgi:hypothetical protein